MPGNHNEIEKRLWDAADELRANSKLNEELETLNAEAREFEGRIAENVEKLMEGG